MLNEVIDYWFNTLSPEQWFTKDAVVDEQISNKFSNTLELAKNGELAEWRSTPIGRLAEVIVLDQFSRNIHRDTPLAFKQDALALILSQEAIANKADQSMSVQQKSFLYMPFMHSESKFIHEQAVKLFEQPGLEYNLDFEHQHKNIIDRFGRYPHRNIILGRESTPEELEFLKQPNSGF